MALKSVTFRQHDHLVSVLFGDLLSHSYNITFSMFLYLVNGSLVPIQAPSFHNRKTCKAIKEATKKCDVYSSKN